MADTVKVAASPVVSSRVAVQGALNTFFLSFPLSAKHKPFREFHHESNEELKRVLKEITAAGESGVSPALNVAKDAVKTKILNPNLVKLAFGIFLTHSERAQELGVVAPELKYYADFKTVTKEPLSNPVTADTMKGVNILAYFREDYDFNDHHHHWHLVYPFTGIVKDGKSQRVIDRQGELFLYMHSQMIARYNAELLSWGLDIAHAWGYDDILTFGYIPVPELRKRYAARPAFMGWYESHNPDIPAASAPPPKAELIKWRDNIFNAIDQGYLKTKKKTGETGEFKLTEDNAHNWIGIVVEAEAADLQEVAPGEFTDRELYGNLHNEGHEKFAEIGYDPKTSRFGVMVNNFGGPRDPCFWLWHRQIDDFRLSVTKKYQHSLDEFKPAAELLSLEIMPSDPNSKTPTGGVTTFLESPMLELNEVNAKMGHESYKWKVTVRSTRIPTPNKVNPQRFTVRIFIIPASMIQDQRGWIEMDKFTHVLTQKQETIVRKDTQSSVARKVIPPGDQYHKHRSNRCLCGWPQNMMLPIGKPKGMQCLSFAMLTDDELGQDKTQSLSFCGVEDSKYPDPRGMGYPFDKTWKERVEDPPLSVPKIVEKYPHTILGDFTIYRTTKLYESVSAPPVPGDVTWDNTIQAFFTEKDKECMKGKFDLGNHGEVALHAQEIYDATSSGRMPQGEAAWTAEKVDKFHTWMNEDPKCP